MAVIQMTRAEYEQKYGVKPNAPTKKPAQKGTFATGLAKSTLGTVKGLGQIGTKIGNLALPKSLEMKDVYGEEELQKSAQKGEVFGKLFQDENLQAGEGEKFGKFVGDVAQFVVPGTKAANITKGMKILPKIAARAATSGAVATAQEGEIGKEAGIAAASEAAFPIAGKIVKPATKLISKVLRGTGSALSGASADIIEQITNNPQYAKQVAKEIKKSGGSELLRKNARTMLEGVSNIKKEARARYGQALEGLAKEDIEPKVFKENVKSVLDKYGSMVEGGKRKLSNVEFTEPTNIKRASELINRFQKTDLDGKSLRKLIDDIENAKYKVATSDERLAFNSFVKDLATSVKKAVNESTGKLDEMNKEFSKDMEIAESIEQVFGKVKFKNMKELIRTSKNIENLFNKKGLEPEAIEKFLLRIGESPEQFKTSEAVRQIGEKSMQSNQVGINPMEWIRSITSAVVSPKTVGEIAMYSGLAEQTVKDLMEKLDPTMRASFIKLLIGDSAKE